MRKRTRLVRESGGQTPQEYVQLAKKIMHYLKSNPEAKDTAAGIAEWWLGCDDAAGRVQDVEKALGLLVKKQQLANVHIADGRIIYHLSSVGTTKNMNSKLKKGGKDISCQ